MNMVLHHGCFAHESEKNPFAGKDRGNKMKILKINKKVDCFDINRVTPLTASETLTYSYQNAKAIEIIFSKLRLTILKIIIEVSFLTD